MAKNADVDSVNTFELWNNFEFQTEGKEITLEEKRKIGALIKGHCCNYGNSNCALMDDHKCLQVSSDVLGCNWFQEAVLPLDPELEAELAGETHRKMRKCTICGKEAIPGVSHAKYCTKCALKVHRKQKTESQRKYRM